MIMQMYKKNKTFQDISKSMGGMSTSIVVGMLYIPFQINSKAKHKNTLNHSHYHPYYYHPNMVYILKNIGYVKLPKPHFPQQKTYNCFAI